MRAEQSHDDAPASGADERAVLDAAVALATRCDYEREHSHQVARLALNLFDELAPRHGLGARDRFLLHCAGILHDIGWIQGRASHHKVAMRVILAAEELGLGDRERTLVALVARYHRQGLPKPSHARWSALPPEDRRRVGVLGGLLRLADGLDRSHTGAVRHCTCCVAGTSLAVRCHTPGPARAELSAGRKKSDLLARALDLRILVTVAGQDLAGDSGGDGEGVHDD